MQGQKPLELALCSQFERSGSCLDGACRFAHGSDELQHRERAFRCLGGPFSHVGQTLCLWARTVFGLGHLVWWALLSGVWDVSEGLREVSDYLGASHVPH